ncbi:GABA permease, partial [Rothia kristinae]
AEAEDPAKGVRQATSAVVWRILLFFGGAVLVIPMVIPWDELRAPTAVARAPFTLVCARLGLPGAAVVMQLIIFTAVLSVLNSTLYSASRNFSARAQPGFTPCAYTRSFLTGSPACALLPSSLIGVCGRIVHSTSPD